jgi:hypothetical protein
VHLGAVRVLDGSTLEERARLQVGVNPVAVAIANEAISPYPRESYGAVLYASPLSLKSGEGVKFSWTLNPPVRWDGVKIDIVLGVVFNGTRYYAFRPRFTGIAEVDPRDTGSLPRILSAYRLNGTVSGEVLINSSGAPAGTYRFVAAVCEAGSDRVVYSTESNSLSIR